MKNNVFRRISALLLAAVMLLGGASALAKSKKNKKTPTPSPTVSAAEKEMYVADDGVFLLEDMSADAEKLFSLPRGEVFAGCWSNTKRKSASSAGIS